MRSCHPIKVHTVQTGILYRFLYRLLCLLLCLLLGVLLLTAGGCSSSGSSKGGDSFRWSLSGEPKTLDPQIAQGEDAFTVILALYEGLTRISPKGEALPGVAERWEHNESYTEWTFYLREDAVWSDSDRTPVTAEDFAFAFTRALDPATGSNTCTPLYCIQNARKVREGELPTTELGIQVVDSKTIRFNLETSCESFPLLTALPVTMPCNQEFFDSTSGRYGLEKKQLLGNGPFVIDGAYGWEAGKHINVKTSSTYKGESSPLPSDISFVFTEKEADVSDPLKALTSGTVDAIALGTLQAQKAQEAGCTIVQMEDTTWGLRFNPQHEALKNLSLRKFFAGALDLKTLAQNPYLPLGANTAQGVIPPCVTLGGESYRQQAGSISLPAPFSQQELTSLLAQGLSELSLSEPPVFTVLCPEDEEVKTMVNEMLKVWNQHTGLYYNMEPLPREELESRVASGDYAAAVCCLSPEADGPYASLAQLEGVSDAYNQILSQLFLADETTSLNLAKQGETLLVDQYLFLPLYTESRYYGMGQGVSGIYFSPYGGGVDFFFAYKD